jgi:hypothetical protein
MFLRLLRFVPILAVCATNLVSHVSERHHREHVMTSGRDVAATVRAPTGLEWVTVHWTDAKGDVRVGTSWTGKPYARSVRDSALVSKVATIRYVDDRAIDPIIVTEVAERQRSNTFWVTADTGILFVATIMAAITLLDIRATFHKRRLP